jgi:hypothetical protein
MNSCRRLQLEAAPGIASRVGSAHPILLLALTQNLLSEALENFQGGLNFLSGGLSPPQPTYGAATSYSHYNDININT